MTEDSTHSADLGAFLRLQNWYIQNCDGDWEHQYGVVLETLDNPGWRLRVDLQETEMAGRTAHRHRIDRNDDDWCHWWVKDDQFHAAGGAGNLGEMLQAFQAWVE